MRKKQILKMLLSTLALFALIAFLPSGAQSAQAATTGKSVLYNKEDKGYYLYRINGKLANKEGIYSIKLTAHKKTFNGIYYVDSNGKIDTSSTIHYVPEKNVAGKQYRHGFYYFEEGGKLPSKKGVVYTKKKTEHDTTLKGYYYYIENGFIRYGEFGLIHLNCKASNGKTFNGYYYREKQSHLSLEQAVRNIKLTNGANKKYPGYHYFDKNGRLDTTQTTRKLDLTSDGKKYKGYYCFQGTDGKLIRKKGLVTLWNDTYYYVKNKNGKCLTNATKKTGGFTYKFGANGKGVRTSTKLASLKAQLTSKLRGYGGTWSVYVKRLDNNDSITINDRSLYAASIIKPFVMASTYNQIKQGVIQETSTITSLNRSMITVSSNDAFNDLVRRQTKSYSFSTGRSVVNKYISNNGYTKTSVHHTLHPSGDSYISDGKSNCTSIKDCGKLLEAIYRGTCVDKSSSQKMLNFLLAQQRRWKIPSGVPSGTKVANKTGETSSSDHDIAIVYSPKCTYILCVMSQNSASSSSRIVSISRTVYDYFN